MPSARRATLTDRQPWTQHISSQPKLIDANGPHGFTLHFHAQVGGKEAQHVLEYLQSIKKLELKPNPFLKKAPDPAAKSPK